MLNAIETLLHQTKEIIKTYPAHKQEPHFFSLFGKYKFNELLHSQIIGELLNPYGHHKQGQRLLQLFLEQIGITLDGKNLEVTLEIEKTLENSDRRIDVWLESSNYILLIENKLFAKDQDKQVYDYWKYAKSKNKVFDVLYLTPHGTNPSFSSRKTLLPTIDFQLISYRYHIQKWLAEILKIENLAPEIAIFLTHYLSFLHKNFGNMEIVDKYAQIQEELKKYSDEDFEALAALTKAQLKLKESILLNFWRQVEKCLKDERIDYQWDKTLYKNIEAAIEGNFYYKEKQHRKPFGYDILLGEYTFPSGKKGETFFRIQNSFREFHNRVEYGIWIKHESHKDKSFYGCPSFSTANDKGDKVIEKYQKANEVLSKYFEPKTFTILKEKEKKEYFWQYNLLIITDLHFDVLSEKNIQRFSTVEIHAETQKWFTHLIQLIKNCKEAAEK